MELHFVLSKPSIPQNIGAAARALATMGFQRLRLVRPCNHLQLRSRSMACGGIEVLERAELFSSVAEATADMELIIGTTARIRRGRYRYYTPVELSEILTKKKKSVERAAIVFGTETAGLSAAELAVCHLVTSIPTPLSNPSINLAQAVMIYAYELSSFSAESGKRRPQKTVQTTSQQVFWKKLEELLQVLEIEQDTAAYHRIMERCSLLADDDIRLTHFVRKCVLRKIKGQQRGL